MLSQLDLQPICKGHSRNQDNDLGNKILATPKKNGAGGPLVIGLMPSPTVVKHTPTYRGWVDRIIYRNRIVP